MLTIPGLAPDQFYFIRSQLLSLIYVFIFRHILFSLQNQNKTLIHLSSIIPGIIFSWLCFGNQIYHLILLCLINFSLIKFVHRKWVHLITFFISMLYLSMLHIKRLTYNDASISYQMDISAPVMIIVQKITLIAFSLHDGYTIIENSNDYENKLNNEQIKYALRSKPTLIEYCSYLFDFQTILCGPMIPYNDYKNYLDLKLIKNYNLQTFPSVSKTIFKLLLTCLICAILLIKFVPYFPVTLLEDNEFFETNFVRKIIILIFVTTFARIKYYYAWKFTEIICTLSGLGFNGYTKNNEPSYDLATNIQIYEFEMSLSQHDAISVWNISTVRWLRSIINNRVPKKYSAAVTFMVSAFWHGFYPGYYLTFATAALFLFASKIVRRQIRPYFFRSKNLPNIYHCITWFATRIMIAYFSFPFMLLNLEHCLHVYQSIYYFGHLIALILLFITPLILPKLNDLDKNLLKNNLHHKNGYVTTPTKNGIEQLKQR